MRVLLLIVTLVMCHTARAATFDEFLAMGGSEFEGISGKNFLRGVTWEDSSSKAYFACLDRLEKVSLELWHDRDGAWVSTRGAKAQPLKFGRHGSIRVFSVFNEKDEPYVAAYFMHDNGETHVFRILDWEVKLSSIVRQCSEVEWQPPTGR